MKLKTSEITCSKEDFLATFELIKNNRSLDTESQNKIHTCIKYYSKKLNLSLYNFNEYLLLDALKKSDDLSDLGLYQKIEQILELDNNELKHYLKVINNSTLYLKVGLDGKIIDSNEKFANTAGYSIEELIGVETKTLSGDFSKERPQDFWKDLWETVLSGKIWQGSIKNRTKAGDYYRTETTIIPKITNKIVEYFTVIRTDVTESEDMKIELAEKNYILEERNKELSKQNIELEALTLTDSLTGLDNRRSFEKIFEQEFARAKREKTNLTILNFDIDYFKKVNDTHGHDVGDKVLKTIGDLIKNSFRLPDFKARIGGEEFVILLPSTNIEEARALGDKFRINVEKVFKENGLPNITISLGAACYNYNKTFMSIDTLYKNSDEALYLAKDSGRNILKTCIDVINAEKK